MAMALIDWKFSQTHWQSQYEEGVFAICGDASRESE
jgi:hypothetical protein